MAQEARLSDTGLASDQNDVPVAFPGGATVCRKPLDLVGPTGKLCPGTGTDGPQRHRHNLR